MLAIYKVKADCQMLFGSDKICLLHLLSKTSERLMQNLLLRSSLPAAKLSMY